MTDSYIKMLDHIIVRGNVCAPRGMKIREIEDAVVTTSNIRETMPRGIGRGMNYKILAGETMQWMAGVSDLAQLSWASKGRFLNYSDDGTRLYGPYGPRSYRGLARAVDVLAKDPDSRQAVASLWTNEESSVTKDLPCTLSWSFRIRGGKLNMSTVMRSWDAWTGVTYDLPAMTRIQSGVAWALGVEPGTYNHTAHSLHVYARDEEAISLLENGKDQNGPQPLVFDGIDDWLIEHDHDPTKMTPQDRWSFVVKCAREAMSGVEGLPPFFEWHSKYLAESERYPHFCDTCRYYLPSGELFCTGTH